VAQNGPQLDLSSARGTLTHAIVAGLAEFERILIGVKSSLAALGARNVGLSKNAVMEIVRRNSGEH
jgi:DNA invertase Pin-like site-specific DNA recombinase